MKPLVVIWFHCITCNMELVTKVRHQDYLPLFYFRPDYAADSSSEESEDEFELQRQKKAPKEEPVEVQENEPEIKDRRLRRLQERDISQDSDDEDR